MGYGPRPDLLGSVVVPQNDGVSRHGVRSDNWLGAMRFLSGSAASRTRLSTVSKDRTRVQPLLSSDVRFGCVEHFLPGLASGMVSTKVSSGVFRNTSGLDEDVARCRTQRRHRTEEREESYRLRRTAARRRPPN